MTTVHRLCRKKFQCFDTMPCSYMPLLVHFWLRYKVHTAHFQLAHVAARRGASRRVLARYLPGERAEASPCVVIIIIILVVIIIIIIIVVVIMIMIIIIIIIVWGVCGRVQRARA